MKIRLLILTVLLMVIAVACTTAAPAQSNPPAAAGSSDVKTMVEQKCTACHTFDRVKSAKKSADEWKTNVERMVSKGAKLSASEQADAIKYLAAAYPK
jgi:hypothetical protein